MIIKIGGPEYLISAAHFLATAHYIEPLHGHNYLVSLELDYPDLIHGMAADFFQVKACLMEVIDQLNHKILLAKKNPYCHLHQEKNQGILEMEVTFPPRKMRYVFPANQVYLLPQEDTTTECLLLTIQDLYNDAWKKQPGQPHTSCKITVEEAPGRAVAALPWVPEIR